MIFIHIDVFFYSYWYLWDKFIILLNTLFFLVLSNQMMFESAYIKILD